MSHSDNLVDCSIVGLTKLLLFQLEILKFPLKARFLIRFLTRPSLFLKFKLGLGVTLCKQDQVLSAEVPQLFVVEILLLFYLP